MAARSIWNARLVCGDLSLPVKLYSALEDRSIRFRLLNRKDQRPIRQLMVHPDSGKVVEHEDVQRAWISEAGDRVLLSAEELAELSPESSRNITLSAFLPEGEIDHRWYQRPYYLGPHGALDDYFAFAEALSAAGRSGLAQWVMRGKQYRGVLGLHQGYLTLTTLRASSEVVPVGELKAPDGPKLNPKEVKMAEQLVGMLEETFDISAFSDQYRKRVLELIESKSSGKVVRLPKPKRKHADEDLGSALQASLQAARKRA